MSQLGFRVRIEAKPEFADQAEATLRGALELAREEKGTVTWFSFKESPTVFGVFDTFEDEQGRSAHLNGRIADALKELAPTMFAVAPEICPVDILAVKLP
ncbi:putative quinol monooxygenase [Streptacidiphilus sp. EB129]|uniref:putative quinol monooxygenase n=1 Tax=Streptacidiphilus sp. EB129 TaxID=3156262 RepID=UPI003517AA6E